MAILLYSTQHLESGGTESHLQDFCEQMQAINVDLVVLNNRMTTKTKAHFIKYCRHVYLCNFNNSLLKYIWLFIVTFRLNFTKYDALYTNGQGNTIFMIGSLLYSKKKWVHHHHTSGDTSDQALWPRLYIQAMLQANKIIACSKWNSEQIATRLGRDIDVIPVFSKRLMPIREKKAEVTTVKLGYFGRLIKEKGIDTICELSNVFTPNVVEFHIWGSGINYPSSFFNNYPNLIFHGSFSTKEELQGVVNLLDGFLLLSSHPEGLPVCLLECMSAGLPWISTNKGGIRDIMIDSNTTRLISETISFDDLKIEIKNFANSIRFHKVNNSSLVNHYDMYFDSKRLIDLWTKALVS